MRIGVLVHDLHGGGAEAVARSWVTGLAGRGHEVVVLVYGPGATAGTASGALAGAPGGVPVDAFRGRSTAARWLALPVWVRWRTHRRRLDVLLCVLDFSNLVGVLALAGSRPVVISEHAVPTLLWRHRAAGGLVKRLIARALYRRADAVVAVSHAVATDLRSSMGVAAGRLAVLPNPVPTAAAAGGPPLRRADPGAAGAGRLLVVGRCSPEKQVHRVLEVLGALRGRGHAWTGCVMGDGPLRAELQRSAGQLGLPIEFPGWVSPWQERARAGDVLLLTSDLEGFGNVLVEAAAAGVPSVAPSPALGVGDAVLPGVTGVLCPTDRAEDLADAVLAAAQLPVRTPAARAWLERFDPAAAARRLEAVLETAVERAAPPDEVPAVGGGPGTGAASRVVTQVGQPPDAQGGMASVLRTYRDEGVPGWRVRFVTSYLPGARAWSAGPATRALLRLLLSRRSTLGVVHVHLSYGGSFVREGALARLAARRGCPVVVTVHGSDFTRFAGARPQLVGAVLGRAARIVLLSPEHRDLLPAALRERAVLVPNTVSTGPGAPAPPPTAPQALFAGEVCRRKGVDVLLRAWPRVVAALPHARLVLAGPAGDFAPHDERGVTWAGPLDNAAIRDLLAASRVAVLPSRREVMPVFVLEAMAAGRPVVATAVGAVAQTLGTSGSLVPVGDDDALAAALVRLLAPDGPAEQLGAAARARFDEEMSAGPALRRLAEVYEQAADAAAAR